jgi:DNA-binding transcriptional MerR regulator
MTDRNVPIGIAATRSGVKAPTIRYYEQIGLLPKPSRTNSNRRNYNTADLRRLVFIRHARELGFEIEAIRALLALQGNPDRSCMTADAIARARLAEVEQRIHILTELKAELERMIADCSLGRVAECRVIEVLSDASPPRREGGGARRSHAPSPIRVAGQEVRPAR